MGIYGIPTGIDGKDITNNHEELNKYKGKMLYVLSYELTVKRKVIQKVVYGKPVKVLDVNDVSYAYPGLERRVHEITYEEYSIEDSEESERIQGVLKEIKLKEDNFDSLER